MKTDMTNEECDAFFQGQQEARSKATKWIREMLYEECKDYWGEVEADEVMERFDKATGGPK
jgi:hypothetical protein